MKELAAVLGQAWAAFWRNPLAWAWPMALYVGTVVAVMILVLVAAAARGLALLIVLVGLPAWGALALSGMTGVWAAIARTGRATWVDLGSGTGRFYGRCFGFLAVVLLVAIFTGMLWASAILAPVARSAMTSGVLNPVSITGSASFRIAAFASVLLFTFGPALLFGFAPAALGLDDSRGLDSIGRGLRLVGRRFGLCLGIIAAGAITYTVIAWLASLPFARTAPLLSSFTPSGTASPAEVARLLVLLEPAMLAAVLQGLAQSLVLSLGGLATFVAYYRNPGPPVAAGAAAASGRTGVPGLGGPQSPGGPSTAGRAGPARAGEHSARREAAGLRVLLEELLPVYRETWRRYWRNALAWAWPLATGAGFLLAVVVLVLITGRALAFRPILTLLGIWAYVALALSGLMGVWAAIAKTGTATWADLARGTGRFYWRAFGFLGLVFLGLVSLGLAFGVGAFVVAGPDVLRPPSPLLEFIRSPGGQAFSLVGALPVLLLFGFAPAAIAVEDVTTGRGIARGLRFVFRRFGVALALLLVGGVLYQVVPRLALLPFNGYALSLQAREKALDAVQAGGFLLIVLVLLVVLALYQSFTGSFIALSFFVGYERCHERVVPEAPPATGWPGVPGLGGSEPPGGSAGGEGPAPL